MTSCPFPAKVPALWGPGAVAGGDSGVTITTTMCGRPAGHVGEHEANGDHAVVLAEEDPRLPEGARRCGVYYRARLTEGPLGGVQLEVEGSRLLPPSHLTVDGHGYFLAPNYSYPSAGHVYRYVWDEWRYPFRQGDPPAS